MTNISRASIVAIYDEIWPLIRITPVFDITIPGCPAKISLKLEFTQFSGSFKVRGAFANLLALDDGIAVTAASGGNHGAAVAYAARQLGHPATIFVPETTSKTKIARIQSYGADVVISGASYAQALCQCESHMAKTGAVAFHAYDSVPTINGQGTVALEFAEQTPGLDTVLIAVGGGGLIGGVAAWFDGRVNVIGVESENCATLHSALANNKPVAISPNGLAVDALGAPQAGAVMFPIAQRAIDRVLLVNDEEIKIAQLWLWENLRLVVEPAGATAFAALLTGHYKAAENERIGIVLCGGNCSLETL